MSGNTMTASAPDERTSTQGNPRRENPTQQAALALIEDDDDIRETMARKLRRSGYEVLAYHDAESALADFESGKRPDLILLDLMMPGMDGWEFRIEQRRRPALADVPVIALSGDASRYAAAIDAAAYLTKPVDYDRLLSVIGQIMLNLERKRLQAKALELERMRTLGMLVAGVAHEINNPLTYVVGNLDLAALKCHEIERSPEKAVELAREIRRTLEVAQDGSSRIAFVVRLLSTFSRGEVGEEKPTDPLAALDAALRLATHHVHSRAHLLTDFHPLPLVRANEARLAQVFLNLLVNAAQAIEGPRETNKITVRSYGTRDRAVIEVEDTGTGISPEVQARIFEPFFSTKPAGAGTGLGLSISRDIVEAVGGTISVQSTVGKGTVFRVDLPAHVSRSSLPAPATPPKSDSQPAPRKSRVLVIDDESSVGWLVRACLPMHEVQTTTDPLEGLQLLDEQRFDVVLCDFDMPGMNGLELYRVVR